MKNEKFTNFFIVPHAVLEDSRFIQQNASAQVVFFWMAKYQNRFQTEFFYRKLKDICEDTGLSKTTVVAAIKCLVENTFLRVEKGGNYTYKHKAPNRFSIFFLFEHDDLEQDPWDERGIE